MQKLINNLLLVDDDDITTFYNVEVLNEAQIAENIIETNSADQAIAYLLDEGHEIPEVILLDLNMPIMNGWEFLDFMIAKNSNHLKHVIILTASANPDDFKKSSNYDLVKGFLNKPLEPEKLFDLYQKIEYQY